MFCCCKCFIILRENSNILVIYMFFVNCQFFAIFYPQILPANNVGLVLLSNAIELAGVPAFVPERPGAEGDFFRQAGHVFHWQAAHRAQNLRGRRAQFRCKVEGAQFTAGNRM